ncbi:endoglucanase [Pseudenhygromyxa sp. WMMC2535]|nr:endoglucanase [Pseudenhygromyxa sp. WMMC2535]
MRRQYGIQYALVVLGLGALACTNSGGSEDSESNEGGAEASDTGGDSAEGGSAGTSAGETTEGGTTEGETTEGETTDSGTTDSGTTDSGTTDSGTTEGESGEESSGEGTTEGSGTDGEDTQGESTDGGSVNELGADACSGYATRYWDCCKAHCGWEGNVNAATEPLSSCNQANVSLGTDYNVVSACSSPGPSAAHTCFNMAPWAVSDTLAYGFAAVPATGDICGRCYQLEFDGTGHYSANDVGSAALAGKTMIVQATNIGYDVGGGQFDILTPGGGVGAFDACSSQWGVDSSELGAVYGGFMTACQEQYGYDDHDLLTSCVLDRCTAVFNDAGMEDLLAGCQWYAGWYETADNPNLKYQEVECPQALIDLSGIDRGPLDDVQSCSGGGGGSDCSQEEMDNCDCAWTNGGSSCGEDDGSCCWTACCG